MPHLNLHYLYIYGGCCHSRRACWGLHSCCIVWSGSNRAIVKSTPHRRPIRRKWWFSFLHFFLYRVFPSRLPDIWQRRKCKFLLRKRTRIKSRIMSTEVDVECPDRFIRWRPIENRLLFHCVSSLAQTGSEFNNKRSTVSLIDKVEHWTRWTTNTTTDIFIRLLHLFVLFW